jgi:hypothetical protein
MVFDVEISHDVMQVCRNGHVITDRLRSGPDSGRSHCDRCGASTLNTCPTCGMVIPGAGQVPGLVPIGHWPAPRCCPTCGATFPWARKPRLGPEPLVQLELLLRRLPRVIRQLAWRQGDRTPYRVEDERDLEDLLRALLEVHFDDVRLETRTPRYSSVTRTDLLLAQPRIALTVKFARDGMGEPQLMEQWQEDIGYYRNRGCCKTLVGFVHDPGGTLREHQRVERISSQGNEDMALRLIVAVG